MPGGLGVFIGMVRALYSYKNMVKNFIVIQIIFAEKFVSQAFTVRAAPGLSGPTNTCIIMFTINYHV